MSLNGQIRLSASVYDMREYEIVTLRDRATPDFTELKMTTIKAEDVALKNPSTSADMLAQSGDVLVQKSQLGGGSPILRGFEANRVLLVIDGVRMNNAIYRSGHLQNAITVDNNLLESTEVIFGPGSVVYGSDALGGVVHFHTRTPAFAKSDTNLYDLNFMARGASAYSGGSAHLDGSFSTPKWGFLTSITASDFGDLRMGTVRPHGYDSLGKVFHFADRYQQMDTMMVNDDPDLQIGTGYRQLDLLQKVHYNLSDRTNLLLLLNAQYSTSSDVPRFDRLNDYSGDQLKFAEWYYGPQNRFLTSVSANIQGDKWFDKANVIGAFQRIDEDRIDRRFGRNARAYSLVDARVYSLNADFVKQPDTLRSIFYGIEGTHNDVASEAYTIDIESGARGPEPSRYPDGGSSLSTLAAYLKYHYWLSENLTMDLGARYSHISTRASFEDTSFLELPFDEINFSKGALSGSAALNWKPENWEINLSASTGFRAPNIDDYGKVFEKDDLVTVPNNQVRPEYAYSGEIGVSRSFAKQNSQEPFLKLSAVGYYTYIVDVIVRREHSLNGEDSLLYDGSLARIVTNTNAGEGVIYGLTLKASGKLGKHWGYLASYNYTIGRDLTDDVPLGHIPPQFGLVGVSWQKKRWNNQLNIMYNGWKRIEDYSPSGVDNEAETTIDGAPAWYVVNLRTSYQLSKAVTFQFAVENLLDHHYKPFASGVSGPGRNFIIALRASLGNRR